jgi:1-acyl-sn-glycerol-3-phosphate acyltransferase
MTNNATAWEQSFMRAGRAFDLISRPFMTLDFDRPGTLGDDPVLMAANHRSLADVFVSLICCYRLGRPTRFIVGRAFFKRPGMGWFLRRIGCIEGGKGSRADLVAIEAIRNGSTCAIMPEGAVKTVTDDRILAPLMPGVAEIWSQTQCPFHAVGIAGAGAVWPEGRNLPPRIRRRANRPIVRVRFDYAALPGEEPITLDRVAAIMEKNCMIAEQDRQLQLQQKL